MAKRTNIYPAKSSQALFRLLKYGVIVVIVLTAVWGYQSHQTLSAQEIVHVIRYTDNNGQLTFTATATAVEITHIPDPVVVVYRLEGNTPRSNHKLFCLFKLTPT